MAGSDKRGVERGSDSLVEANTEVGPSGGERSAQADVSGRPAGPRPGDAIGRYVILARLGEGGMGVVYVAHDPELDRKLAVKLLRPDTGAPGSTTEGRTRLLREAQAMARLSHPNVVTVHDVGSLGDQVFVAMELVEGSTLSRWLAAREGLDWREIVDVFVAAGRGLAAAHRRGIVHRDFKPDNVLVGQDGRVRVADFGLARATGPEASSGDPLAATLVGSGSGSGSLDRTLTLAGTMMGTPAYMAPEQFLGKATDARSDQFSFCVALFEALHGRRPFAGDTLDALRADVLTGSPRPPPADSAVPSWIQAVLMRGLRRVADERYPSMEALLADLERDPGQRLRRRLRIGVAAALLAGAAVGAWALVRGRGADCATPEARLAGVWDDARKKEMHAAFTRSGKPFAEHAFSEVQRSLDGWTRDWSAAAAQTCADRRSEELRALATLCLSQRLGELRALTGLLAEADVAIVERSVIAAGRLGDVRACRDARTLAAVVMAPPDPGAQGAVEVVGKQIAHARALRHAGKYKLASQEAPMVESAARATGYRPVVAEALLLLSDVQLGNPSAAESDARRALAEAEACRHDEVVAWALVNLVGAVGKDQSRWKDALDIASRAEIAIERVGGSGRLRARLADVLGSVLSDAGRYDEAVPKYQEAIRLAEVEYGPLSASVAGRIDNLAGVLRLQGKYDEALGQRKRALAMFEKLLGPDHPEVALTLGNLGSLHADLCQYPDADLVVRRALAINESVYGADSEYVANNWNTLGVAAAAQGKYDDALADYRRALAIRESAREPDRGAMAATLGNVGAVLHGLGRNGEALTEIGRALAMKEKAHGAQHPSVAVSLTALATVEGALGRWRDATAHARRAVDIRRQTVGPQSPVFGDAVYALGTIEQGQHHREAALASFEEALAIAGRDGASDAAARSDAARCLLGIGEVRLEQHRVADAVGPLRRALELLTAPGGGCHDDATTLGEARFDLAQATWPADREGARDLARRALEAYRSEPGVPETRRVVSKIEAWLKKHSGG